MQSIQAYCETCGQSRRFVREDPNPVFEFLFKLFCALVSYRWSDVNEYQCTTCGQPKCGPKAG
jgi:hypothetical protein